MMTCTHASKGKTGAVNTRAHHRKKIFIGLQVYRALHLAMLTAKFVASTSELHHLEPYLGYAHIGTQYDHQYPDVEALFYNARMLGFWELRHIATISQESFSPRQWKSASVAHTIGRTHWDDFHAQNSRCSHAPPPGLQSRQSKTNRPNRQLKDRNYAPLDKPSAQLHNSSFRPKPVECGRTTRKQSSLNGYNCVFILA